MDLRFIYITTKDLAEAQSLGLALVEERWAACVNLIEGMQSIYWWNDELQRDRECVLVAKTRADLVEGLVSRVKELHSYDVPCVVALPILAGNPEYLAWVAAETRADGNP